VYDRVMSKKRDEALKEWARRNEVQVQAILDAFRKVAWKTEDVIEACRAFSKALPKLEDKRKDREE